MVKRLDRSRARLQALYQFDLSVASGPVPDVNSATRGQRICLAGCDEAGRGALAGPATVACVHLPVSSGFMPADNFVASGLVPDENVAHKVLGGCSTRDHQLLHPPSYSLPSAILSLLGVDDSKRLTPQTREALFEKITQVASFGIGWTPPTEIDRLGIVSALKLATRRAYRALGVDADLVLLDRGLVLLSDLEIERLNELKIEGFRDLAIERLRDLAIERLAHPISRSPDHSITQSFNHSTPRSLNHSITQSFNPPITQSFTRGDSRSLHIACASIIAKVARDRLMNRLERLIPGYELSRHKGYGTAVHRAAILRLGPSPIHRRSFKVG